MLFENWYSAYHYFQRGYLFENDLTYFFFEDERDFFQGKIKGIQFFCKEPFNSLNQIFRKVVHTYTYVEKHENVQLPQNFMREFVMIHISKVAKSPIDFWMKILHHFLHSHSLQKWNFSPSARVQSAGWLSSSDAQDQEVWLLSAA